MDPDADAKERNGRARVRPEPLDLSTVFQPLDPAAVRFRELENRELTVELAADGVRQAARVERSFPLTAKERYIIVRDAEGDELGIIADINDLDPESREVVRRRIEETYFMPRITRVNDIHREFTIPIWDVETDRGSKTFELRSNMDARFVGPNHIYIKDADGLEYEIPDYRTLDRESQILIERYV